jgi:hypothetical protein
MRLITQCGEILEIKIFRETNTNKCYSYIEFDDPNSKEIALNLSISIDQNHIEITKLEDERFLACIFNMNKKIYEKDLIQFFSENNINYKELIFSHKSQDSKYSAVVEFYSKVFSLKIRKIWKNQFRLTKRL